MPAIRAGERILACPACVKEKSLIPISSRPVPLITPSFIRAKRAHTPKAAVEIEPLRLVENYGAVIRQAREKLGLTQAELAMKIAEKLSVIKKVEAERLKPDERLAQKLERALKIRLIEE